MAKWKPLDQMVVVSQFQPRVDGPLKVTGRARYTSDQQPKGLLYGAILGSPHAAARVTSIDAARARALPGVKAVLTDAHPTGNVRYAGDYVAAVAATTPEIARDALELIAVEYEPRGFVVDMDQALRPDAPRVFEEHENAVPADPAGEGDVEAGFAAADAVVEAEYRTQVQTHSPLETHGSVASWEGDELTIWDSTQAVHGVREGVAKALEMPLAKVRVICEHMGGGFGSKLQAGRYTVIAARLAREAGAPVKLMLTRQQEHLSVGNRPDSIQRLRLGARRDGAITAFSALTWGSGGIGGGGGVAHPWVYQYPAWSRQHHDVYTNTGEARPFRAPGRPQTSFAVEQLLDEMAAELGLDPLEMRLRNDPSETRQQEWRLGAERIGWSRRGEAGAGKGPVKRGLGLGASSWWGAGRGTKAAIDLLPDGTVEVKCGTQDLGTGTRTIVAAVAAEELGLPIGAVDARIGDSRYPYSGGSGGSTTAASVAPAIKSTAEKARAELAAVVAPHLNARPEDRSSSAAASRRARAGPASRGRRPAACWAAAP
ncbi:MAG: xanthine dehydrogenase family protein molybdopterin-binding subunit [Gemmatimonadota bacterium]